MHTESKKDFRTRSFNHVDDLHWETVVQAYISGPSNL